jgi:hypothetical protein
MLESGRLTRLASFLSGVLQLPEDELWEIAMADPNFREDAPEDKQNILDVYVKTPSGRHIDVEIQIRGLRDMRERIMFYNTRMLAVQLKAGRATGCFNNGWDTPALAGARPGPEPSGSVLGSERSEKRSIWRRRAKSGRGIRTLMSDGRGGDEFIFPVAGECPDRGRWSGPDRARFPGDAAPRFGGTHRNCARRHGCRHAG